MKNVTLRQLRVFASVARHLKLHACGRRAESSRARGIDANQGVRGEVGLPVFDRTSRQVSLSPAAEAFRYFLERGEAFLALHFASLKPLRV